MSSLRSDGVFQKLAGLTGFPVQSTISRFLQVLRVSFARQVQESNLDLLMRFRNGFRSFSELTLDLDSHVTTVYGKQQRAGVGYNPKKKGRKSYQAFLCFIADTRDYLGGHFRNGRHSTFYGALAFIKRVRKNLPSHLKKIRFRADSGFFCSQIIEFLTRQGIDFYIVAPLKHWVQKYIAGLLT
jgi:hypothetical protein